MAKPLFCVLTLIAMLACANAHADTFRYDYWANLYTQTIPVPETTILTFSFENSTLLDPQHPDSSCNTPPPGYTGSPGCVSFKGAQCTLAVEAYGCTVGLFYEPSALYPTTILMIPSKGESVTTAYSIAQAFDPNNFAVGHHVSTYTFGDDQGHAYTETTTLDITDLGQPTPIPEPSSIVLLGSGALGAVSFAYLHRRRVRSRTSPMSPLPRVRSVAGSGTLVTAMVTE